MTDVYWLEQTESDVSAEDSWLSASEMVRLNSLYVPKRRVDWRLGRWTLKRAAAAYLDLPADLCTLAAAEIRRAPSGAPEVFLHDRPAGIVVSLTHRSGTAACAVASANTELGCDLEAVEPRSDTFIADFFTTAEQSLIAQAPAADRPWFTALLWSAKESALKALHAGLRLDTRWVQVHLDEIISTPLCAVESGNWHPLRVSGPDSRLFHGWWVYKGDLVRTLVAAPAPSYPIALKLAALDESHCASVPPCQENR